jgi:hypothetical protein
VVRGAQGGCALQRLATSASAHLGRASWAVERPSTADDSAVAISRAELQRLSGSLRSARSITACTRGGRSGRSAPIGTCSWVEIDTTSA